MGVGRDQGGFTLGPFGEQLGRRCGTHQTRVMDADVGEFRYVTRSRDVAPEVPDHLVGIGEPLRQEAAAVLRGEHAGVAPTHAGEGTRVLLIAGVDLEDVDDQQVAGLGPFDVEGSGENVHPW